MRRIWALGFGSSEMVLQTLNKLEVDKFQFPLCGHSQQGLQSSHMWLLSLPGLLTASSQSPVLSRPMCGVYLPYETSIRLFIQEGLDQYLVIRFLLMMKPHGNYQGVSTGGIYSFGITGFDAVWGGLCSSSKSVKRFVTLFSCFLHGCCTDNLSSSSICKCYSVPFSVWFCILHGRKSITSSEYFILIVFNAGNLLIGLIDLHREFFP